MKITTAYPDLIRVYKQRDIIFSIDKRSILFHHEHHEFIINRVAIDGNKTSYLDISTLILWQPFILEREPTKSVQVENFAKRL